MAEQFTEAGKLGRGLKSSLTSAYKRGSGYINDLVTEYGQEPLLNLYPQSVNLLAAGGEAIAGAFDKPVNLGRYPYYDLPTRFDERISETPVVEQVDETPTITVSKKPRSSKLWRVMTEGGDRTKDEFYNSREEANEALKKSGGKGIVMGLKIPEENQSELKRQYIQKVRDNWGAEADKKTEAPKTEEDFLYQQITRLNPNATEEQKKTYVERLSASRAKRREREGYSDEYAARLAQGTLPTEYEQRRMKEESSARGMRDFITATRVRDQAAKEMDREYQDEMKYLRAAERESRKRKDYAGALQARQMINEINSAYGISSRDGGNRIERFKDIATEEIRRNIKERDEARRDALRRQTNANPEVS